MMISGTIVSYGFVSVLDITSKHKVKVQDMAAIDNDLESIKLGDDVVSLREINPTFYEYLRTAKLDKLAPTAISLREKSFDVKGERWLLKSTRADSSEGTLTLIFERVKDKKIVEHKIRGLRSVAGFTNSYRMQWPDKSQLDFKSKKANLKDGVMKMKQWTPAKHELAIISKDSFYNKYYLDFTEKRSQLDKALKSIKDGDLKALDNAEKMFNQLNTLHRNLQKQITINKNVRLA